MFVSIQFKDLYKSHKGSIFSFEMKYSYGKSKKQHYKGSSSQAEVWSGLNPQ